LDQEKAPTPSWVGAVLVGFPFVGVFAVALALLARALGYRPQSGDLQITTIIAIVIGTRFVIAFQERFQKPSRLVLILSGLSWAVLLTLLLTRVLAD